VDTETGELLRTEDIDNRLKQARPYRQWLKQNTIRLEGGLDGQRREFVPKGQLKAYMKLFQVSMEEREQVLRPLAEGGQEAVGSMGDDTPMAVLSRRVRPLYDFFRQQFAQVTNPPIDPLREAVVMSLETCLGAEKNVFEQEPDHALRAILSSPVLSPAKFERLLNLNHPAFGVHNIELCYDPAQKSLQQAIIDVCDSAEQAVRSGKVLIVLSDRNLQQ